MNRKIILPDEALPARLTFDSDLLLDDDKYYDFCMANPDLGIERSSQGEIIISPPAGGETSYRSGEALGQLAKWAIRDGRGKAFDASAEFILPTRAALSPNAAWVSNAQIQLLSKDQRRKFPPVCPEFIIEVLSPSDRLPVAQAKMREWIRAGVELAWLIDGETKTAYVYLAGGQEPEVRTGILKLAGQGPVAGFKLDLTHIWEGL